MRWTSVCSEAMLSKLVYQRRGLCTAGEGEVLHPARLVPEPHSSVEDEQMRTCTLNPYMHTCTHSSVEDEQMHRRWRRMRAATVMAAVVEMKGATRVRVAMESVVMTAAAMPAGSALTSPRMVKSGAHECLQGRRVSACEAPRCRVATSHEPSHKTHPPFPRFA